MKYITLLCLLFIACLAPQRTHVNVEKAEFIYSLQNRQTPECHASTIEAVDDVLIAAWFGGKHEKNEDVGIWMSRHENKVWSTPIEVVNGVQNENLRYPCWNPVLFQPSSGPLMLFYKVGPNPREWWGMLTTSADTGKSWSAPIRLPDGFLGPIKNKPIELANGDIYCPASTEHDGWKVHFEILHANGHWDKVGPVNDGKAFAAIQPTLLVHSDSTLQALNRTKQGVISQLWSDDLGQTWSAMTATELPNPNSGVDAVTLQDGRHMLVYNPVGKTPGRWGGKRSPLNIAISDDGKKWQDVLVLEDQPGEFSYPAIIQDDSGRVHIVYTWKRKTVKYVSVEVSEK